MIKINDDYYIDVDRFGYTVKIDKHKTDKKGNGIFETVGYFSTIESAIKGVIDSMNVKQLSDGVYSLKQALEIIKANNKQFTELLERVVKV